MDNQYSFCLNRAEGLGSSPAPLPSLVSTSSSGIPRCHLRVLGPILSAKYAERMGHPDIDGVRGVRGYVGVATNFR